MRYVTYDLGSPSKVNLGFWPFILAAGGLVGAVGYLVHTIKSPSASQRLQFEQLKKQQEELKRKAFLQKAAIIGGITVLVLVGIKQIKKSK